MIDLCGTIAVRGDLLRLGRTTVTVRGVTHATAAAAHDTSAGIDRLIADTRLLDRLRRARTGLLTHDACRTSDGTVTRRAVARAIGASADRGLVRLFTPEHGLTAAAPAGIAVGDGVDAETGVPIVSLYGPRLAPDAGTLADLDIVVIDLRDVGVRCFTYAATAARLIAAAAATSGPDIIVCDRPNPLGAQASGPMLDPTLRSFVAWLDVRFVHGRTIGQLLRRAAADAGFERLDIVAGNETSAPADPAGWIAPSPALDHPHAVRLYPGLVLLEGTNLSEGRGTAAPFRSVAAPWLDTAALATAIGRWQSSVVATEGMLTPTTGRYAGLTLPALTFEPTGRETFDGLAFGVRLIRAVADRHRQFAWTRLADGDAPVPGDGDRYVVDALLGSRSLREGIARGDDADAILARWQQD